MKIWVIFFLNSVFIVEEVWSGYQIKIQQLITSARGFWLKSMKVMQYLCKFYNKLWSMMKIYIWLQQIVSWYVFMVKL